MKHKLPTNNVHNTSHLLVVKNQRPLNPRQDPKGLLTLEPPPSQNAQNRTMINEEENTKFLFRIQWKTANSLRESSAGEEGVPQARPVKALADKHHVLRRFRQQVNPLHGKVTRDGLKHPLLVRVGEADETFRPPHCWRKRTHQALETLAHKGSLAEKGEGVKVVVDRCLAVMSRRARDFPRFAEQAVVFHIPPLGQYDLSPWVEVAHLGDKCFEGVRVRSVALVNEDEVRQFGLLAD